MRTGKLLAFGCFAAIGVGLMSCSKADVFDSNAANELKKEQQERDYTSDFVKKYGAIEGKSWDLATLATSYTLESSNRALTRDGEANVNADATTGEMIIEKNIITWMVNNMKAGANNVKKGKPFYLQVPENSFTIVPIFQGTASYYWQLWMHVDGLGDKLVWSKGDDIYYKQTEKSEWTSPGTGQAGISKTAYEVKAPTYEFANLPVNAKMYFYLKVWKGGYTDFTNNAMNPIMLSSLNQKMLALMECPIPANVPEGNKVAIIGCEDATDNDYEDLVFMMYGNPVPPITHVDEVIEGTPKRYMMEDLGEEHPDFDFNDVVVDVISGRVKKKYFYDIAADGSWIFNHEETIENLPDIAIVRAAGGILDFTLTIGDTTWKKSKKFPNYQQMLNTGRDGEINYDKELDWFEVKGWNPDKNNISVTVEGNSNDITFPKTGEAPKVIAVDPTTNWMFERTPAPESWFKD